MATQKLVLVHETPVSWLASDPEVEIEGAASSDQVTPFQVRIRFCAVVPLPKVPVATQNFVLTQEMPFSTLKRDPEVEIDGAASSDQVTPFQVRIRFCAVVPL